MSAVHFQKLSKYLSVFLKTIEAIFAFSLWYNRVIIGLVIGAPWIETDRKSSLIRGGLLGLLVSFAFYATTGFQDPISF